VETVAGHQLRVSILREAAARDPDQGVERGAIRVLTSMDSLDAGE
jgi:hypothetical protein